MDRWAGQPSRTSGARTLTATRALEPIEGSFRVDCGAERISSVFESIVERGSARRSLVGRHFAAPSALRLRFASPVQAPRGRMRTGVSIYSRPSYGTNLGYLLTKPTSNWRRRAVTEVAGTLASQASEVR